MAAMKRRSFVRAAAALAGPSIVGYALTTACDPQEIYLYDRIIPPIGSLADAGRSGPPREAAVEPAHVDAGERKQPPCNSAACDACVEQGSCDVEAQLFCHPDREGCSLACDATIGSGLGNDCPASQRCDRRLGLCVQCVADGDCGGESPVCDVRRGSCVECTTQIHCPTALPICDPASSRCVECNSNLNCPVAGEVCSLPAQRCVQCRSDDDCGDAVARRCLPGEQRCVECISNGDCNDPTRPLCSPERECEDVDDDDDDDD